MKDQRLIDVCDRAPIRCIRIKDDVRRAVVGREGCGVICVEERGQVWDILPFSTSTHRKGDRMQWLPLTSPDCLCLHCVRLAEQGMQCNSDTETFPSLPFIVAMRELAL